jgi:hypothetical protein
VGGVLDEVKIKKNKIGGGGCFRVSRRNDDQCEDDHDGGECIVDDNRVAKGKRRRGSSLFDCCVL